MILCRCVPYVLVPVIVTVVRGCRSRSEAQDRFSRVLLWHYDAW